MTEPSPEAIHAAAKVIHDHTCDYRSFDIGTPPTSVCVNWPGHLQLAEGVLHAARSALPPPAAARRFAELETAVARLIGDTGQLGDRVKALEAGLAHCPTCSHRYSSGCGDTCCQPPFTPDPPKRDPASTTAATTAIATPGNATGRRREVAPVRAFGFSQTGEIT